MGTIIALNIVIIILIAIAGACFVSSKQIGPGWFGFVWAGNAAFWLSVAVWICYIAGHFLMKFW